MIVLVDQDNVLADFELEVLNRWRAKYPDRPFVAIELRREFYVRNQYPAEFRPDVEAIYTSPGFIRSLPVIAGSVAALNTMQSMGHDVWICTSPLSKYEHCVLEKFEWVEKNLGREWTKKIIISNDKTLVRGSVLIDDKPEITGVMNPFWEHVVFDQPWNRQISGKRRLDWTNWESVLGFTKEA